MLTRTWPPAAQWQREAAAVLRAAHWQSQIVPAGCAPPGRQAM
jgi:hypothetical protein